MKNKDSKEWLQIKVGAFIILGIGLCVFAIFILGSKSGFFKNQYVLHSYFDDISGLDVGSQVVLAGVNIGHVEEIIFEDKEAVTEEKKSNSEPIYDSGGNLIQETGVKVRVTLKINEAYQDRIRTDSVASITTQGLLGDSIIYLSVGTRAGKKLEDGEFIRKIRNPVTFTHLQRKGELLMKDVRRLIKNTDGTVRNVNAVLTEVKEGNGLIHKVIYDKDAGKIVDKAGQVVDNLNETSRNFANISNKIDAGQGTIGKFVNDPGVYNELKLLLGKANRNKLVRSVIRYTLATRDESQSSR
jgi:phospholipid/cholesterol/gamma-HCH transport system substrate-binding protein